jgi:pre-rRNA-processing protein TSR2
MTLRNKIIENDFSTVEELHQRFLAKPRNAAPPAVQHVDQDAGSSDEDEDGDEEMGDAPAPAAAPRERQAPEVDEDGFETVRSRRRK